jgi:hypothetical protein
LWEVVAVAGGKGEVGGGSGVVVGVASHGRQAMVYLDMAEKAQVSVFVLFVLVKQVN